MNSLPADPADRNLVLQGVRPGAEALAERAPENIQRDFRNWLKENPNAQDHEVPKAFGFLFRGSDGTLYFKNGDVLDGLPRKETLDLLSVTIKNRRFNSSDPNERRKALGETLRDNPDLMILGAAGTGGFRRTPRHPASGKVAGQRFVLTEDGPAFANRTKNTGNFQKDYAAWFKDKGQTLITARKADPNRKTAPSESLIWQKMDAHKTVGSTTQKTNGLTGGKKRLFQWDRRHRDIEMYNRQGLHLGTIDPITGKKYKGPVEDRIINTNRLND